MVGVGELGWSEARVRNPRPNQGKKVIIEELAGG